MRIPGQMLKLVILASFSVAAGKTLAEQWQGLRSFVEEHGAIIDPAVTLKASPKGRGLYVTEHIPANTVVITVPNRLYISVFHMNGSISSVANPDVEASPVFAAVDELSFITEESRQPATWAFEPDVPLVLWLALEMQKNDSYMAPYLDFFKDHRLAHPCEIPPEEVENMTEDELARVFASRLETMPPYERGAVLDYYNTIRETIDPALIQGLTLHAYLRAFYLVVTHAFNSRDVRTLVPLYDFANHDLHPSLDYTEIDNSLSMWTTRDLQPGDELTIRYHTYGNYRLYYTYGFVVSDEQEYCHEWNWYGDGEGPLGELRDPFMNTEKAFQEAVESGLSPLEITKKFLQPKLDALETELPPEPREDSEAKSACFVVQQGQNRSANLAVKSWKPVIEASYELEAAFGQAFTDSLLGEGGSLTRSFIRAAIEKFASPDHAPLPLKND